MAEEGVGRAIEVVRDARERDERAHQHEQRDDRELLVQHRREGELPHHGERRVEALDQREADEPDQHQAVGDRHAEKQQHEQDYEADRRDKHRNVSSMSSTTESAASATIT